MEYKGYILEQSEVFSHELNWHHFGVILNVVEKDFTCIGQTIDELQSNFVKLVDDNFDELQSMTEPLEVTLDEDVIAKLQEIESYKGMTSAEIATRTLMSFAEGLRDE